MVSIGNLIPLFIVVLIISFVLYTIPFLFIFFIYSLLKRNVQLFVKSLKGVISNSFICSLLNSAITGLAILWLLVNPPVVQPNVVPATQDVVKGVFATFAAGLGAAIATALVITILLIILSVFSFIVFFIVSIVYNVKAVRNAEQ